MNSVANLIKSKVMSFVKCVIDNYKKLNLKESDAIILCKLYYLYDSGVRFLSVQDIASDMTLSIDEVSNNIIELVNGGYISIDIVNGKEEFNLDGTMEKLSNVIVSQSSDEVENKKRLIGDLVIYLEKMFNKVATPTDLSYINRWLDEERTIDDIKQAILNAAKLKKFSVQYADAILNSRKPEREIDDKNVNEDIKRILNAAYDIKK